MSEEFWGGLILTAAYLGRESVCINALTCLRFAKAINDRSACSIFNYIPDLHGQEMQPEVARNWPAAQESWKFHPKLHLIHPWNISVKPLNWLLMNFWKRFLHKFCNSPTLILTNMLICNERESVKYGDYPDRSKWFHISAHSSHCWKLHETPKQTTSSLTGLTAN